MQKGKPGALVVTSNSPPVYNMLPTQSRTAVQSIKTILKSGGYRNRGIINLPSSGKHKEIPQYIKRKATRIAKRFK